MADAIDSAFLGCRASICAIEAELRDLAFTDSPNTMAKEATGTDGKGSPTYRHCRMKQQPFQRGAALGSPLLESMRQQRQRVVNLQAQVQASIRRCGSDGTLLAAPKLSGAWEI